MNHRKRIGLLLGVVLIAGAGERQLGAHLHGHGTVNIVIEGTAMLMELEAPGADIVGFEHAAETAEDKAAIEAAEVSLSDPLSLFAPPAAAGCVVEEATMMLEGSEDHAHMEFHATYQLSCSSPERIDTVTFAYFERFPGAEGLTVNVVSKAGQSRHEVGRDDPVLRLDRN